MKAVQYAIALKYNNGLAEGSVNKLKVMVRGGTAEMSGERGSTEFVHVQKEKRMGLTVRAGNT